MDGRAILESDYPLEDGETSSDCEIDTKKIDTKKIWKNFISIGMIQRPLSDDDDDDEKKYTEENCQHRKDVKKVNRRIQCLDASSCHLEPDNSLKEYIEISKGFSSLLPHVSIKSLFLVDDLLYGEHIKQDYESVIEVQFLFHGIDVEHYIDCHSVFARKGVRNIFMDTALMQLMEHMPISFQKWPYQHLLQSKDVYDTCVALKIILAGAHNEKVKFCFKADKKIYEEMCLCMEYLSKIPQGCSTNGKRLSEFISYHAAMFMNLMECKNIPASGSFDLIKASVVKMISERRFPANKHIVSLIDTFMNLKSSERNELPSYLFELLKGTDESVKEALKYIGHRHDANKPNTLPQKLMRIIFDNIITNTVCLGEKLLKVEEKMKFIDAVYGYKIEPYFPMDIGYKYYAFDNKASMNNEASGFNKKFTSFKEFQGEKLSYDNEDEIIFHKFFVYDEFMRNLHCMSIFHELFLELEKRFEIKFPQSFVYSNFWNMVTTFGLIPWYVKMIVMKCPFLLKSSENKFIDMSFNDLTCEEKEFIDRQNWTNRMYDIEPASYVNKQFSRSSPATLPNPENYFIPDGKTFSKSDIMSYRDKF